MRVPLPRTNVGLKKDRRRKGIAANKGGQLPWWDRLILVPLSATIIGFGATLGADALDRQPGPLEPAKGYSCQNPWENVEDAVEKGIDSKKLLERINDENVDRVCGEEVEIAEDIRN